MAWHGRRMHGDRVVFVCLAAPAASAKVCRDWVVLMCGV